MMRHQGSQLMRLSQYSNSINNYGLLAWCYLHFALVWTSRVLLFVTVSLVQFYLVYCLILVSGVCCFLGLGPKLSLDCL